MQKFTLEAIGEIGFGVEIGILEYSYEDTMVTASDATGTSNTELMWEKKEDNSGSTLIANEKKVRQIMKEKVHPFMYAFDIAQHICEKRFLDPLWKLKRYFKLGLEAEGPRHFE